jgi:5-methylcytosine-specific restriction enzyme A
VVLAQGRRIRAAKDAKRVHGYTCQVCAFDFAARYGEVGREFGERHHVVPFAELDELPPAS